MKALLALVLSAGVLVAILFVGLKPIEDTPEDLYPNPYDRTRFHFRRLEVAIHEYESRYGQPASSIEAVAESLRPNESGKWALDAWDRAVTFAATDTGYALRSGGEDGQMGTDDDVTHHWSALAR